tara:strand:- start:61 stop:993 length:933 start_codon:yes stop_codon:yes gene_type:complete
MTISIEILILLVVILLFIAIYFYKTIKDIKNNEITDNQDTKLESLVNDLNENTLKLATVESEINSNTKAVNQFYTLLTKGGASVGKFGEIALSVILENAGLKKDVHFFEQKNIAPNLRPDITINLPDNKYVVLDSKVSLTDFSESINTEDHSNADKYMENHIKSVKYHVDSLKKYLDVVEGDDRSLELIIMFMPIEAAYIAACNDNLISHAIKSKVAIVGPTTLIAILQIIAHTWNTKTQSENISKIVKLGTDISNEIINVNSAFEEMEKALIKANSSIETGKKRTEKLLKKADKLGTMGIPSKEIKGKS